MWPATAWDDDDWEVRARGWTVMGRLTDRQAATYREAQAVKRAHRQAEAARRRGEVRTELMRAVSAEEVARKAMLLRWAGGFHVVAMLFAHPDSDAIRTLDARGEYFNVRTGNTWDLFFPGYHQSDDHRLERAAGSRPIGRGFASGWYFNARDFDVFRRHVESASGKRWQYSGGTDLVLVNSFMPDHGDIVIDWESTLAGSLSEGDQGQTLTVAQVIERLSSDLESGVEDPNYGVGDAVLPPAPARDETAARDVVVGALAGIAAALGKRGLGL